MPPEVLRGGARYLWGERSAKPELYCKVRGSDQSRSHSHYTCRTCTFLRTSTLLRTYSLQSCHNPTVQPLSPLSGAAEVLPEKPTKYMIELMQKPRIRGVLLRHGKTLQFNRTTNKDAILAFTRGEVAEVACNQL